MQKLLIAVGTGMFSFPMAFGFPMVFRYEQNGCHFARARISNDLVYE